MVVRSWKLVRRLPVRPGHCQTADLGRKGQPDHWHWVSTNRPWHSRHSIDFLTSWQTERCVGQTGAVPRLGIRSLCLQDSPLGVRSSAFATVPFTTITYQVLSADYNSAFPAGGTIAASWDRDLFYERGFGMGSEHKGKGVDIQLGPVVGPLGRSPEGGRNWEGA